MNFSPHGYTQFLHCIAMFVKDKNIENLSSVIPRQKWKSKA